MVKAVEVVFRDYVVEAVFQDDYMLEVVEAIVQDDYVLEAVEAVVRDDYVLDQVLEAMEAVV